MGTNKNHKQDQRTCGNNQHGRKHKVGMNVEGNITDDNNTKWKTTRQTIKKNNRKMNENLKRKQRHHKARNME